jgi:hypothetical protein
MSKLHRVMLSVRDRDAYITESLLLDEVSWETELAGRESWYSHKYGLPVRVVSYGPVLSEYVPFQVTDHTGVFLCWYCLSLAVTQCAICGACCCGDHAWAMRPEVRELLAVPPFTIKVECSECVCK